MVPAAPLNEDLSAFPVHATCIAIDGRGILILGASGSGKSSLALQIMAYGAELVSDDRTLLIPGADGLYAACPDAISGVIEARGIGLLNAHCRDRARLELVIDLDQTETSRLPDLRHMEIQGYAITSLRNVAGSHFAAAIVQYMKGGRVSPS